MEQIFDLSNEDGGGYEEEALSLTTRLKFFNVCPCLVHHVTITSTLGLHHCSLTSMLRLIIIDHYYPTSSI